MLATVAESSPPPPRMVSKHLLMLTRDEASSLRRAKQAESHRNPLDDLIAMLCAILRDLEAAPLLDDFIRTAGRITADLLAAGELDQALVLARVLHQLAHDGGKSDEQQRQACEALAGILHEKTVPRFQQMLDGGESVHPSQLREILLICGSPSLPWICELLGRVGKLRARKLIVEVLAEIGRDEPQVFAPLLADSRWYLVRNLVLVLSMAGNPAALEIIAGVVSHPEQRVRKEVFAFVERFPSDPRAISYLLRFLRDDSPALRIRALHILARRKARFALKAVLALAAAEDFKTKGMAEKKAVYEAIGELGSSGEYLLLGGMLRRKYWFNRSQEKESVLLAVAALTRMATPAALKLLQQARRRRSQEIVAVIDKAIATITAASGEPVQIERDSHDSRDKTRSAERGNDQVGEGVGHCALRAV